MKRLFSLLIVTLLATSLFTQNLYAGVNAKVPPKFNVDVTDEGDIIISLKEGETDDEWLYKLCNHEYSQGDEEKYFLSFSKDGFRYTPSYGFRYLDNKTVKYSIYEPYGLENGTYVLTIGVDGYYDVRQEFKVDMDDLEAKASFNEDGKMVITGKSNPIFYKFIRTGNIRQTSSGQPIESIPTGKGKTLIYVYSPGKSFEKIVLDTSEKNLKYNYSATITEIEGPKVSIALEGDDAGNVISYFNNSVNVNGHTEKGSVSFYSLDSEFSRSYPNDVGDEYGFVTINGNTITIDTSMEIAKGKYSVMLSYFSGNTPESRTEECIGSVELKNHRKAPPKDLETNYNPETGEVEISSNDGDFLSGMGYINLVPRGGNDGKDSVVVDRIEGDTAYFATYGEGTRVSDTYTTGSHHIEINVNGYVSVDSIPTIGRAVNRVNVMPKVVGSNTPFIESAGLNIGLSSEGTNNEKLTSIASRSVSDSYNGDTNTDNMSDTAINEIMKSDVTDKISASVVATAASDEDTKKLAENIADPNEKVLGTFDLSVALCRNQDPLLGATISDLGDDTELSYKAALPAVAIPDGYDGVEFYVERMHDGKVEQIANTTSTDSIPFSSGVYSIFAITYKFTKSESDPTPSNSESSSSSSSSSSKTVTYKVPKTGVE